MPSFSVYCRCCPLATCKEERNITLATRSSSSPTHFGADDGGEERRGAGHEELARLGDHLQVLPVSEELVQRRVNSNGQLSGSQIDNPSNDLTLMRTLGKGAPSPIIPGN